MRSLAYHGLDEYDDAIDDISTAIGITKSLLKNNVLKGEKKKKYEYLRLKRISLNLINYNENAALEELESVTGKKTDYNDLEVLFEYVRELEDKNNVSLIY